MELGLEEIEYGFDEADRPVAILGAREIADPAELLREVPGLLSGPPLALARMVVHFARGPRYRVVADPAGFCAAYRARWEADPADEPWDPVRRRPRDFPMPDLERVAEPHREGGAFVFAVEDRHLGIPFEVRVELSEAGIGEPEFRPL